MTHNIITYPGSTVNQKTSLPRHVFKNEFGVINKNYVPSNGFLLFEIQLVF